MKKMVVIICLILLGCSSNNDEVVEAQFVCTVDYIEFTSDESAIVKFDVIVDGISDSFTAKHSYTTQNSNYFIGDEIVNIYNFVNKGNKATFDFEYGSNLGPFCAELFSNIPFHNHYPFAAEADKDASVKNTGRWEIKKKRRLESIEKPE
jgi:hypothetical protein